MDSYQSVLPTLVLLDLSFRQLSDKETGILHSCRISDVPGFARALRECAGVPLMEFASVTKCNASLLLAVAAPSISATHIRQRLFACWDTISGGLVLRNLSLIKYFAGEDAIARLGETAVGLHSIALGDNQVLSQVLSGLRAAVPLCESPLVVVPTIATWLESVADAVRSQTRLNSGLISCERLAVAALTGNESSLSHQRQIAIVGLGQSGKLVAEILLKETRLALTLVNRSAEPVRELTVVRSVSTAEYGSLDFLDACKAVVLALAHTDDTRTYAISIFERLVSRNDVLVVELSSPTFAEPKTSATLGKHFVSLETLSAQAEGIRKERKAEATKAKVVVNGLVARCAKDISSNYLWRECQNTEIATIKPNLAEKAQTLKARDHILRAIRQVLSSREFTEVHTPCIVAVSTDPPRVDAGGVFPISWLGNTAFLRQSNQLYKQMLAIACCLDVYEIGQFWRREASCSYRHLEEAIGVDVESLRFETSQDICNLAFEVLLAAATMLREQGFRVYPRLPDRASELPMISYREAVQSLSATGISMTFGEDIGLNRERRLWEIVQKRWGYDAFAVYDYPDTVKKFYAKRKTGGLTETFDLVVQGWEIASGSIRETDIDKITGAMRIDQLSPERYTFYLDLLKDAPCHGGFGMGFDRLVAVLLGIDDVRNAVAFPRTLERLIP